MGAVTIGIDIGQSNDPTALAILETESRPEVGQWVEHYIARRLERLPLGTPYPKIAARLAAVVQGVRQQAVDQARRRALEETGRESGTALASGALAGAGTPITTYVDATGVGKPVLDMLDQAGVSVIGVYFTHGDRRTEEGGRVTLGKAYLVSRLQALLQSGRLHLPDTAEAKVLAKELLDYEIRVDQNANDQYGAFKVGTHDDLVTAVGLAVQREAPAPATQFNYAGQRSNLYAPRRTRGQW